jgi:hypothetical protein
VWRHPPEDDVDKTSKHVGAINNKWFNRDMVHFVGDYSYFYVKNARWKQSETKF